MTLTPAYGRVYTRKTDVIADFNAGKDFLAHTPYKTAYVSKPEIEPGTWVQIRYGTKLERVVAVYVA